MRLIEESWFDLWHVVFAKGKTRRSIGLRSSVSDGFRIRPRTEQLKKRNILQCFTDSKVLIENCYGWKLLQKLSLFGCRKTISVILTLNQPCNVIVDGCFASGKSFESTRYYFRVLRWRGRQSRLGSCVRKLGERVVKTYILKDKGQRITKVVSSCGRCGSAVLDEVVDSDFGHVWDSSPLDFVY